MKKYIFTTLFLPVAIIAISQTVSDYEGNVYGTITLGTQTWMRENLRSTRFANGDPISNVTDNNTWKNLTTAAYCWYNNDTGYKNIYGALYNWYAAAANLCPSGWHLPTFNEWDTLAAYLGGGSTAGGSLKDTGTALWSSPNTGATNSSGFTALPGGARITNGTFNYPAGQYAYFWTSTPISGSTAWGKYITYYVASLNNSSTSKYGGFSVRCIKDQVVSIHETVDQPHISVYPLPAHDRIFINAGNHIIRDIAVYDLSGTHVKTPIHNDYSVDVSHLLPGYYLCRIDLQEYSVIRPVIIR